MGGVVPLPDEISQQIDKLMSEPAGGTGVKAASNGYGQAKAVFAANGVRV